MYRGCSWSWSLHWSRNRYWPAGYETSLNIGRAFALQVFIIFLSSFFPRRLYISNHLDRLKEEKVIVATQGEERNVIALTPPLCFTLDNARRVIEAFDRAFSKIDQQEEIPLDPRNSSVLGYSSIFGPFYK